MPAQIRKYAFDTVFSAEGEVLRDGAGARSRFTAQELEQERQAAFERGQASEVVKTEQHAAAALESLARSAQDLLNRLDTESRSLKSEAAALAIAAARAAAGAALTAHGEARILAAFDEAMDGLKSSPRLVLRLAPSLTQALIPRIEAAAAANAYAGAIVVRSDASTRPGDVTIEWAEGAVAHNQEEAMQRIEALIAARLAEDEAATTEGEPT